MEKLIENILSDQLYTIIAGVALVLIVFFVIKKLLKLFLYALILFLGFLAYVHYTGGSVEEEILKTKEKGEKIINEGKENLKKLKILE